MLLKQTLIGTGRPLAEVVAFGDDGLIRLSHGCANGCFMRRSGIHVTYVIFDLLSLDGNDLTRAPYSERRAQLETLNLNGVYWQTPETFNDGPALFEAVCAHELEGVVAKRLSSRYLPGERGWVKIKHRDYWRYEMERESAITKHRVKQFV